MKMKAEFSVILLKVKERQRLPENYQKLDKCNGIGAQTPQKQPTLMTSCFWTCSLWQWEIINLLFEPLSFWYFVMVTLVN